MRASPAVEDAAPTAAAAAPPPAADPPPPPPVAAATLESVLGMLQRLLQANEAASLPVEHQQPAVYELPPPQPSAAASNSYGPQAVATSAPASASSSTAAASAGGGGLLLPAGGMDRLLALELEVVALQQGLAIAAAEFEGAQQGLARVQRRAEEAEERAQAAERRVAELGLQVRQMEQRAGEAAARQHQECSMLAARAAAAAAKQQAAEAEASTLRRQLDAAAAAAGSERQPEEAVPQPPPPPPPLSVPRLQLSTIILQQLQQRVQEAEAEAQSPGSPLAAASELAAPAGLQGGLAEGEAVSLLPLSPVAQPAVLPGQRELLATAAAWQRTAWSAAAGCSDAAAAEGGDDTIAAYRPHQACQQQALRRSTPRTGGGGSAAPTPRFTKQQPQQRRKTYGEDAAFLEVKEAYTAVVSCQGASSPSRWARSAFSSSSAVDTRPAAVEPQMECLLRLLRENGVPAPLVKCGPCQYRLGGTTAKLTVRIVNRRLVARAGGAGASVDVLTWLERQPMVA